MMIHDYIRLLGDKDPCDTDHQDSCEGACGWNGPGWYFYDETQAFCYGPFKSHDEAKSALHNYVEALEAK